MNTSIIIELENGLLEVWYENHTSEADGIRAGWYAEFYPLNEGPRFSAIWGPYATRKAAYNDIVKTYNLFAPHYEDVV